MFNARQVTEDGLELTFATNHMSYFVLTHGLRERLTTSAHPRHRQLPSSRLRGDLLRGSERWMGFLGHPLLEENAISPEKGAETIAYLASLRRAARAAGAGGESKRVTPPERAGRSELEVADGDNHRRHRREILGGLRWRNPLRPEFVYLIECVAPPP